MAPLDEWLREYDVREYHETVVAARDQAPTDEFVYRTMKRSRLAERA